MAQISLSQDQLNIPVEEPAGWRSPNPSFNPKPFAYFNSYTAPAYYGTHGQNGSGIKQPSNQFNSAVTQKMGIGNGINIFGSSTLYKPFEKQLSYDNQLGGSVYDVFDQPIGINPHPHGYSNMQIKAPKLKGSGRRKK